MGNNRNSWGLTAEPATSRQASTARGEATGCEHEWGLRGENCITTGGLHHAAVESMVLGNGQGQRNFGHRTPYCLALTKVVVVHVAPLAPQPS